ncbi:S-adenosyl-L-methionine-dependent methyltransferase [Periconia macrospinosa]|uniref:S-adenosyl-L-methionine-dependent methyltransferase n=1 Tax=Periconia macrospinosa TaxID=97972 RepID=A0A2V1E9W3_9PLEO|nr:S-adenosyl-L-methionine-dependent methyltransferase [Periconia macrospinosa]
MSTNESQPTPEKAPAFDFPAEVKALLNLDNFKLAPVLDAQAQAALLRPNDRLSNAIENSKANGLPPINVQPMSGQHLSLLAQFTGAKSVLEIGTLGGYSSIVFAQAGAKVTSVEINAKHRDVALQNTKGLDVDIILGAALDVMPKLYEEGRQFDMVFIDGDWESLPEEFDWAVKLTRVGGCILLDDVVPAMLLQEAKKGGLDVATAKMEGENVITKIGKDERVQAALMSTVGTHPMIPTPAYTGFILAIVKSH